MKKTILHIVLAMLWPLMSSFAQDIPAVAKSLITLSGKVTDEKGEGLPGASVKVKDSKIASLTDAEGRFRLTQVPADAVLTVSFIGYLPQQIAADGSGREFNIMLQPDSRQLDEVIVSTGYQELPAGRATGSFVHLDNELINRRVSTHILERIEGITPGLIFNRTPLTSNEKLGISIRGRSTIDANVNADPLIVLDNFPYEGDIANINPNDVESITVLKDAAAASIWGAKAGNGVIVITSKKGAYNRPMQMEFNGNLSLGNKPDVRYSPDYIPSADFIGIEQFLFAKGYFDSDLSNTSGRPPVSPAVEIMALQRSGKLGAADVGAKLDALAMFDIRNDFNRYVYRGSTNRQFALNLRGGGQSIAYRISAAYDGNTESMMRNGYSRISLSGLQTYRLGKKLELRTGINWTQSTALNNANISAYGAVNTGGFKYTMLPYNRLADDSGDPLPVPKDYRLSYIESTEALGFLDWQYRPLEEIKLADHTAAINEIILKPSLKYSFSEHLNAEINYQFENQQSNSRNYRSLNTYYARNLVNQYAQRNPATGTFNYAFPLGGILDNGLNELKAHNLRSQLNWYRGFGMNQFSAMAGAEVRSVSGGGYSRTAYGYDDELGTAIANLNYSASLPRNPSGTGTIASPAGSINGTENRYISYFLNAAYTYDRRYTLSLSGRKDGANIFGVKTNDRVTPLWSAGLAWNLGSESFYSLDWLPQARLRAAYGYNGNVYNASAYLTAKYFSSSLTGLPYAFITRPPNPDLRWERVRNINLGLDFSLKDKLLSGTIEVYRKEGLDLIEEAPLPPSSGFTSFRGNAAEIRTNGIDINLNSQNLRGLLSWESSFLISMVRDRIISFDKEYLINQLVGTVAAAGTPESAGLFAVPGRPLFGIYSYRWGGIDPQTGDPIGYIDGQQSKDYLNILRNATPENIIYNGPARPTVFGSLRNTFTWKGISASLNITYKLGYYFRRRSISLNYQDLLNNNGMHKDYLSRWQKPGDEVTTDVPSPVYPANTNRSNFYRASEVLVDKGDHVRLQDTRVAYTLDKKHFPKLPVAQMQLYVYGNNLGILWKASRSGIDPDYYGRNVFPNPQTWAFGLKAIY
ncbi:MAG: SusC/RagA family TonB-linked outer membrane protein [Daejeonella sp.]|uniref:SusC/RagA family TonB-linked outer membrane protein n=1 Tax=Daejeonella sp. TaxID=2805397 RepID=UPI0027358F07|nr:SusC/RagA family TonB-linked outer membrane protein [Daejeonella sp.]MDP3467068.1 SusC/RagA family TonB-linked outer membrane protein [Daejeonella sp.]